MAVLAHAGTDSVLSAHKMAVVGVVCTGSTQQAALYSSSLWRRYPSTHVSETNLIVKLMTGRASNISIYWRGASRLQVVHKPALE
jgi:hypothetical protein